MPSRQGGAPPDAAGDDAGLSVFNSAGTCDGLECSQTDCCVPPQLCSASSFSNDDACAGGADATLSVFDVDGACSSRESIHGLQSSPKVYSEHPNLPGTILSNFSLNFPEFP